MSKVYIKLYIFRKLTTESIKIYTIHNLCIKQMQIIY